jgi:menaquinone-9 beta-reductase
VERARVVVVGGGPAGIATALFAAHAEPRLREGLVVLERERYPREKYCAGAVGARADRLLGSIGVTVEVPSVPIEGIAFRAMGRTRLVREPGAGRVVRRLEFDHALAREAVRRSIDVREGVTVTGLDVGHDGVRVETDQGPIRADIVVGADGVRSRVRRALGLDATPYLAQAIEVDTPPVAGDLARDVILFDAEDRTLPGYYWEFPTVVSGEPMVCRGVYYLKSNSGGEPPLEIRAILQRELARRGLALGDFRQKRYAERGFHRNAPVAHHRVILVGEAAGIDPVTGEGIAQAVQYGAVAGRYLARKLHGHMGDLSDWAREIRRTMIGRDLLTRTAALPLFYGVRRPDVERFLLETPEFIQIGLQHFAGKRWSSRAFVRGGTAALAAAIRAGLRSPLSVSPAAG